MSDLDFHGPNGKAAEVGPICPPGFAEFHTAAVLLHLPVLGWFLYSAPHNLGLLRDLPQGLNPYHITSAPQGQILTFRNAI